MIALLLVLSTLSGCTGETLTNVKNAMPPRPAAVTFTVELEPYEDTVRDEDGTVLAECSYEIPVMRVLTEDGGDLKEAASPEQETALAAAEAFNTRFAQWKENPQALAEGAKEDREFWNDAGLAFPPYTDDLSCTVYQSEHLVSVSGVYSTYTGGAHPNSLLMSWNFDLETGEFFEPELLTAGGDLQDFVKRELLAQAREAAAEYQEYIRKETAAEADMTLEDLYWEDYEDTLAEWSSYAVSFDEAGMTVGFSTYELACYAAGPQIFHIPYERLYPHLGEHSKELLGLDTVMETAEK